MSREYIRFFGYFPIMSCSQIALANWRIASAKNVSAMTKGMAARVATVAHRRTRTIRGG